MFTAKELKLTIAIGHTQQEPEALDDIQVWYIPRSELNGEGIPITEFSCWDAGTSNHELQQIRVPVPEAYNFDGVPNNDWIDTYNAAKVCTAVYVVRGKLLGEIDRERKTYPTDPPEELRVEAEKRIHAIRWEWFEELRSESVFSDG